MPSNRTTTIKGDLGLPTALPAIMIEIRRLAKVSHRTAAEDVRFYALCSRSKSINETNRAAAARTAKRTASVPAPKAVAPAPVRSYRTHAERVAALTRNGVLDDTSRLSRGLLRDIALQDLASREQISPASQDRLDGLLCGRSPECDAALLARHVITTGRPAYRTAWLKSLGSSTPVFTPSEAHAIGQYQECQIDIHRAACADTARQIAERAARGDTATRAANEGTGSAGGFGIPCFLDPTIVVVAGGVESAQLLSVARTVLTTSNNYHAFTAPSTGFATDAEAAVSADNSPTFAGPDIPVYTARDFIPYSIEFGQDQAGWADNASILFGNAFQEYVSAKTATGSGTSDITGVFTAMANCATNPVHVTVTTPGTLAAVDLANTWSALPERYRVDPSCAWLLSPSFEQQVAALAAPSVTNGLAPEDFVTNRQTGQRLLYGRPVMSVSDAPPWTGTTGNANVCVVGAFQKYVVPMRLGGYSIELIPLLRDTSTGRPDGQRGFLATCRVGGDVIDPAAFRLLANS